MGVDARRGLPCAPAALFPGAFGLGGQRSIVVGTAACTLLDPAARVLKLKYLNDATCVEQWMVDTLSPTLARIISPTNTKQAKTLHRRHALVLLQFATAQGRSLVGQLPRHRPGMRP